MKRIAGYMLYLAGLLLSLQTVAQHRSHTKKSVPYRSGYQRMSSGSIAFHTLEIRDGSLWAWGSNESGQLGDGSTNNQLSPVRIGTDNNWVAVATAYAHSVGIKSDGTLWGWGYQPWSGAPANTGTPMQIGTDNKWTAISAGDSHTLALKSDGTLWAWGWNSSGELGTGNNNDVSTPVQVGTGNNWVYISASHEHSLAIKSDGTLWAWGLNDAGELGIGSVSASNVPVQVGNDTKWVSVSGGTYHSLGIKADGTLWTWGDINGSTIPVQTGTEQTWISISGGGQSMALKSDGSIWSLQNNNANRIGTDNNWVAISANYSHNMAVKSDGTLWAWGSNDFGQLGDGTTNSQPVPVQIGSQNILLQVSAGQAHGLLLRSNGSIWSWGNNEYGQLGLGNNTNQNTSVQVGSGSDWAAVAAGAYVSAGIKSNGTLWAWGYNDFGQVGDGSNTTRNLPVPVGTGNDWVSVRVGDSHCLGLKSNGTLWAWGKNAQGQLGDGSFADKNAPIQVGTANDWVDMSAGGNHSLAVKADGTLWAWGWNPVGQLGDGSNIQRTTPVQIGNDHNWVQVTAGDLFSLARKSDGSIWAWGSNQYGQLGTGSFSNSNVPVQVGPGHTWIQVERGLFHSLAIQSDGTLWAWGRNDNGQLGDGTNATKTQPVKIGTEQTWVSITGGLEQSLGIKARRDIFCGTGGNASGQLGNQTNISLNVFNCGPYSGCVPPAAPVASPAASVCSGSSATLTATGTGTLGWYTDATGGTWLGGGTSYTTGPITAATTYYVQDSTCSASNTRTAITINLKSALPPPAPIVTSDYICNGESGQLSAFGSADGQISWYSEPTGGQYLGSGPWYRTPALSSTGAVTEYRFYAQDSVCVASASRMPGVVYVYPSYLPVFDQVAPICYGSVPPVLPATSLNGVTGTWSPSTVSNTSSATYTFTPTGNYLECNLPVTMDIIVLPGPAAAILNPSGNTSLNCVVTSIQLTATGGSSYSWSSGLGNQPSVLITSPGTYTVQVSDESGCTSEATTTITGSTTTQPLPVISGPSNVCSFAGTGQQLMFTVPVSSIPTTYTWIVPPTVNIISGQGNDTLIVTIGAGFTASANKQIRVRSSSVCGVSDLYIHYLKASFPGTAAAINGPVEVCPFLGNATEAVYSINPVDAASAYLWSVPAGASITTNLGTSIGVSFTNSFSSGYITVRAQNNCGVGTERKLFVSRNSPLVPGLIDGPANVCLYMPSPANPLGLPAMYKVSKQPNAISYQWAVPAGASILGQTDNGTEDIIMVSFSSQFTNGAISVQAVNDCGTSATRSLSLARLNPSAPGIIDGPTDACGYIGPGGFVANYTVQPVANTSYYEWEIPPGSTDITGQGTRSISFRFPAGFSGGPIYVRAVNGCGISAARKLNIVQNDPGTPGQIQVATLQACPDRIYQYSVSPLPYTPSIQWTAPPSATILSGQGTEMITVSYPPNHITGLITATGENACGLSSARELVINLPDCAPGFSKMNNNRQKNKSEPDSGSGLSIYVYPNPSPADFRVQVYAHEKNIRVTVRVIDLQGREMKRMILMPDELFTFGGNLKPGAYLIEVSQADKRIVKKLVKL